MLFFKKRELGNIVYVIFRLIGGCCYVPAFKTVYHPAPGIQRLFR
jgi:hypothetical protein